MTHPAALLSGLPLSLPLLAIVACGPSKTEDSASEGEVEQLETLAAEISGVPEQETTVEGTLRVNGSDRDWALVLEHPGGSSVAVDLHTPGGSDLSGFADAALRLGVASMRFQEARSILLSDEAGLAFVADIGVDGAFVESAFGHPVAKLGTTLSTSTDDTYTTTWGVVEVQGDDGPVSLAPGEVDDVVIDGATWRVAAVAAWSREALPDAELPGCDAADELVSYEMLRVAEAGEREFRTRPDGLSSGKLGCH